MNYNMFDYEMMNAKNSVKDVKFYSRGSIRECSFCKEGEKKNGICIYFSKAGKFVRIDTYEDDVIVKTESEYKFDVKNRVLIMEFHENECIKKILNFREQKGYVFYNDGHIKEQGPSYFSTNDDSCTWNTIVKKPHSNGKYYTYFNDGRISYYTEYTSSTSPLFDHIFERVGFNKNGTVHYMEKYNSEKKCVDTIDYNDDGTICSHHRRSLSKYDSRFCNSFDVLEYKRKKEQEYKERKEQEQEKKNKKKECMF